ncbi:MAG: helix-turn-helix domain-containing protein [Eubacteriales bacterium]
MSEIKKRELNSIKEIRVLIDPYRQEILSRMNLMARPATSKEIATAMKEAPSKVNYHLKVLEEYDFVEIDHTENINGIIAKYYKRTITNFDINFKEDDDNHSKSIAAISMIESMFNNARDRHLGTLREKISQSDELEDKEKGMITTAKLYMNEEEVKELGDLISKYTKNSKEQRDLYSLFVSFIKQDD